MADAAGHRKQVSRIFYGKMARNMGDPWQNNWTPSGAAKGNRLSIDLRGRLGCDAWDAANGDGSASTSDMTQCITIQHHLVTDAANKKGSASDSKIWIPNQLGKNSTNEQDSETTSSKAKWIPRGPTSTSDITKWSPIHCVTDAVNNEGSASDIKIWIPNQLGKNSTNEPDSESTSSKAKWIPRGPTSTSDTTKWSPNHCVTDAANKEGSDSDIKIWIPNQFGKNSTNEQDSESTPSKAKWIPRGPTTSDITKWSPIPCVTDAANKEGSVSDIKIWIPNQLGKNSTNEQDSGLTSSKAKWIPRGPTSTSDITKWSPIPCVTDAANEDELGTNCSFECKPGCQTAGVAADAGGITASGSFHNYRMRNYDRQQTRSPLKPESNWRAQCKMGKNIVEPPARIPQKNQMHSRHHPSPSDGPNEKKTPIEISNWRIRPAIVESPSQKESERKTEPKPIESDKNSIKNAAKQIDKSTKSNEKSIGKNSRKNGNKSKKRDAKKNVILELSMLYVDEPRHKNRFELLDTSD